MHICHKFNILTLGDFINQPKNNVPFSCGRKMVILPCAHKLVKKSCYIF
jgi:hypothetical protein